MPASLPIARTVAELRAALAPLRAKGGIGLVPTMGGLHEGHLTLVRRAKALCGQAVATIFVNPRQFDRKEDLERYPRDEAGDAKLLTSAGCDLLFAPALEAVYPPGFASKVSISGLTDCLDGLHRPGHFDGVSTVVTKLLLQSLPDAAFFGEKDFQQLLVVRRLVRDLDIPVTVHAVATVREPDGLALSSRNRRLSAVQRGIAPLLAHILFATAARLAAGEPAPTLLAEARRELGRSGFTKVDYLELRAAEDLAELNRVDRPARLLAAAWLGTTRLVDNVPLAPAAQGEGVE